MSVQELPVDELMKEGFEFIKVTLETGENITLAYGDYEYVYEKLANLTADVSIFTLSA